MARPRTGRREPCGAPGHQAALRSAQPPQPGKGGGGMTRPVSAAGPAGHLRVLPPPPDAQDFLATPVRARALDAVDKTKSLPVFDPAGVVCSHGALRARRRALNDQVLASHDPVRPSWDAFRTVIAEE